MDNLRTLLDVPDWKTDAHCLGMDPAIFFPIPPTASRPSAKAGARYDSDVAAAKAHCRRCDVQAECLAYALANGEPYGVWGGLSVEERRRFSALPKSGRPSTWAGVA